MSALQKETIKKLRAEIAELKKYKRQATVLMQRNDELLNEIKKLKGVKPTGEK